MQHATQTTDSNEYTGPKMIYDSFFAEGARTHERTDWFLIFHAILLEAFFTEGAKGTAQVVVAWVGLVTGWLWFLTGYRQSWVFMHLGNCMTSNKNMTGDFTVTLQQIFNARKRIPRPFRWAWPVSSFCVVTPAAFVLAWLILLAIIEFRWEKWLGLAASVVVCGLATLAVGLLGPGPEIPKGLEDLTVPSDEHPQVPEAGAKSS